jgi:2-hydroxy-6-oxonona-2,4-dienedioate hydrolase
VSIWTDLSPIPFRLTYVDAAGVRTRALQAGEGPLVIMLHGTSGHLEAFSRNLRPHVEAGFACHAIDMLGHGYTDKPGRPYEIPDYVQHVLDYADAVGAERFHILGESLGGWVGARLAADHPERVISLQLLAAGGTKANPEVMQRIRESTREAVRTDDVGFTRRRLELLMADPAKDVSDELVDIRYAIYQHPDFKANIENLLSLQDLERRLRNLLTEEQMGRIVAPTLVVWGRQNPFGDVPEAELMHRSIPGSRLVLFDGCGHWPQHEKSDEYNPISLAFLADAGA